MIAVTWSTPPRSQNRSLSLCVRVLNHNQAFRALYNGSHLKLQPPDRLHDGSRQTRLGSLQQDATTDFGARYAGPAD